MCCYNKWQTARGGGGSGRRRNTEEMWIGVTTANKSIRYTFCATRESRASHTLKVHTLRVQYRAQHHLFG